MVNVLILDIELRHKKTGRSRCFILPRAAGSGSGRDGYVEYRFSRFRFVFLQNGHRFGSTGTASRGDSQVLA